MRFTLGKFSSAKMFVKPPPSLRILLCVELSKLTNGFDDVKPALVAIDVGLWFGKSNDELKPSFVCAECAFMNV